MPVLRATFIILSAPSPLTTYNLGTSTACHPDLLVLVFNLVVDLGYVVESRTILVLWFTLATLAFAHMHLQVLLAGALDRATLICLRASLLPLVYEVRTCWIWMDSRSDVEAQRQTWRAA